MTDNGVDLERFLRGEVHPAVFPHEEHIRMGFEMLRQLDFAETVFRFSAALRAMTARIGKPQAFHQTMTIAFLSLIAERADAGQYANFDSFARANADLFDRSALFRWYAPARLATDAARRTFLLPDPMQ